MNRTVAGLIVFGIIFGCVFGVDYFFIKRRYLKKLKNGDSDNKRRKKKNNGNDDLMEIGYLVNKFKLDKSKLPLKRLLVEISLINAFIIVLVSVVVLVLDIYTIFKLLIGFVLLFALIYAIYELLGRHLVKVMEERD